MSILKMTKPNKIVDDTPVIVRDFKRRAPFWSYRTADYKIYQPLELFEAEIDAFLEKLFAGEVDDGNADILDTMISDVLRQAEHDLEHQRTEHRDMISSFGIRAKSDKMGFEMQLQKLKEDLEKNRIEQEQIRNRLSEKEFLEVDGNEEK